ncbi:TIGR03749 family integrating conjugative element protein [Hydrogenovibrio sp. SC-1]|uniref:TIGR03749 family integrating conjugative element protein n=1 Tax=Hydrogenovibrio sp. SC-1 TaxID=2065820 RepID=UPI000C7BF110|nr:TIGR03749 family integrating conjugative element protein [Hydrogenovibrio sp. SC-1]PLA73962.1 TIGR03749 family integrating conjugative element protein [Hydrogenovibrio sp. SC-1]
MRILFFLVITLVSQVALSDEHIVWDKTPIELHLSLGNERQVVFPDDIEIGISNSAINRFKTITSVDNRMFIEPSVQFERQRILVRESKTGINYVIYLSVKTDTSQLDPVAIIHKENKVKPIPSQADSASKNRSADKLLNSYPYLTRYVAQQLYAPKRLVRNNPAIQRISVLNKSFTSLFRCTSGSLSCTSIVATPLISYKTGLLYASALRIKNVSDYAIDIDPRLVKSDMSPGALLAATSMHGRLLPSRYGDKSETVIIIIHKRPLLAMFLGLNQ